MNLEFDQKFRTGYCLEFAVALLEKYQSLNSKAKLFLCQKLRCDDEDGSDYETSHAIVKIFKNNKTYGHDIDGIHELNYFEKHCLFSEENQKSVFELNGPFELEDAESYLGAIEESILDEARLRVNELFELQVKKSVETKKLKLAI